MQFGDKIRRYFSSGDNRYRLILLGVGVLTMVGVVLFSSNIQNLLNPPGSSRASVEEDLQKTWDELDNAGTKTARAHAKSIVVNQGGKRWLYVIGGLETYIDATSGETRMRLLNTVERIELDKNSGEVIPDAQWQSVSSMKNRHAESSVLTHTIGNDSYLYVIAGDIHVPYIPPSQRATTVPLLYSTIERMKLNVTNPTWEVISVLSGVNFYTEAIIFQNNIHVVGGVYGNPFLFKGCAALGPSGNPYGNGTTVYDGYTVSDPIDIATDLGSPNNRWNVTKPVVGPANMLLTNQVPAGAVVAPAVTVPVVNENETSTTGVTVPQVTTSRFTQFAQAVAKRFLPHVPAALAQAENFRFTKPAIYSLLSPGSTYQIRVEGIPTSGYTEIHFAYLKANNQWSPIRESSIPTGQTWYEFNWTVPNGLAIEDSALMATIHGQNQVTKTARVNISIGKTVAQQLSESLLSGRFATTVSEHYSINPSTGQAVFVGELGKKANGTYDDFTGTFSETWEPGKIMHIGHLRFTWIEQYANSWTSGHPGSDSGYTFHSWGMKVEYPSGSGPAFDLTDKAVTILPIPQGRYGHELFIDNNQLVVLGGASWMPALRWTYSQYSYVEEIFTWDPWDSYDGDTWTSSSYSSTNLTYFWVIEDGANYPDNVITFNPDNPDHLGPTMVNTSYKGRMSYRWNATQWDVSPLYAFLDNDSQSLLKGRAFFGFTQGGPANARWSAVGGLINQQSGYSGGRIITQNPFPPANQTFYAYGIPVEATNFAQHFNGGGWVVDENYVEKVYNLSLFSLKDRLVAFGGQTSFICSSGSGNYYGMSDAHIPDPTRNPSNKTVMYVQSTDPAVSSWRIMSDIGAGGGVPDLNFTSDIGVVTTLSYEPFFSNSPINNLQIYRFGGMHKWTSNQLVFSDVFQTLGNFTDATPGTPYPGNSSLTAAPLLVASDGYSASIATITLRDYFNDPVVGMIVRLYTSDDSKVTLTPLEGERIDEDTVSGAYLKTNESGIASWKVTSTVAHLSTLYGNINMSSFGPPGQFPGPAPVVQFTDENVPNQQYSTLSTDKSRVVANLADYATLTVELRGKKNGNNNQPLPGFYVGIYSNRTPADGSAPPDIITPLSTPPVTNASGQVKFTVKSDQKGLATFSAAYAATAQQLIDAPILLSTPVDIRFIGMITSLIPSSGVQGQDIPFVTAEGSMTSWDDGSLNADERSWVEFSQPSVLSFTTPSESFVLEAGAATPTEFTITAPSQPNNTVVNLSITTTGNNVGSFFPSGQKTTTVTLVDGTAKFWYRHGTQTGPVSIHAAIGTTIARDLVVILANTTRPYVLELSATPPSLNNDISQTQVRAILYRWVNGARVVVKEPDIEVNFVADDNGTLSPTTATIDTVRGDALTTYTRGGSVGERKVLAYVTYQDSFTVGGFISIGDNAQGGITCSGGDCKTADIDIDVPNQRITVPAVHIDEDAMIGFWTFNVYTPLDDSGNNEPPYEINSAPFQVFPVGTSVGPRLVPPVNPNSVIRPATNLTINLTGADTTFTQGASQVIFTPKGSQADPADIQVVSVTRHSFTSLSAVINVTNNAYVGYWDVKVVTTFGGGYPDEVAEMAGDYDFLVAPPSDYVIDIVANPNIIPRDGRAKSNLTVTVGKFDNTSGDLELLSNVVVTFGLQGDEVGGALDNPTATTVNGVATNAYTTDSGSESAEIYITVSATINGIPVANRRMIIRQVNAGDYLTLATDRTFLSIADEPSTANLTAQAFTDEDHTQPVVPNTAIHFLIADGSGTLMPIQAGTDINGTARSLYTRATGLTQPTNVTLIAKANIAGIGVVFSNSVIIDIGVDTGYVLTVACTPQVNGVCQVAAGGGEAQITATLKHLGNNQPNWPVSFILADAATGDYLTKLSGNTNAQGQITTIFRAGLYSGTAVVSVEPLLLPSRQVAINKIADDTVSRELSTITANPRFVPADNSATSAVIVTLRNANFVPLAGKTVTVTSNNLTNGDNFVGSTIKTTGVDGRAMFYLRSGQSHESEVTASVVGLATPLGPTTIVFEPVGSLIAISFDITIPYQAKAYDRNQSPLIYLREQISGEAATLFEVYKTDANDKLVIDPSITIYLHPSSSYSMWAKGPYHLSRVHPFITPATSGTITFSFANPITPMNSNGGLLIGDLDGRDLITRTPRIPDAFHDNGVFAPDFGRFVLNYFRNDYVADFDSNGEVGVSDFVYFIANYGQGGDAFP